MGGSQARGIWRPEYRLANTLVPSILLPTGLGIYGAGVQYHLHFMILAFGSFLLWFSSLLALSVCFDYAVECFLKHAVEASGSLNACRLSFGLMSVFILTDWQVSMAVGWMYGLAAFLMLFVDIVMVFIVLDGHVIREWTVKLNPSIANTEDGGEVFRRH
ncbi:hypothetical protein BAUCODRAFT_319200 [Baudoinia panamericana UAMH 10762]|uniref:Uncharacterized protein n=1 Tax=Baudoinia panamericana (strain UAMH 10762) TaxID=717646 RepID=M2M3T7_BAUPA|nr:uncharacterized protein BAUCODRAFT_319200 [Baudoinia panamericana UAMH 10762]EMC91236.1 hypothetical protein BAUCODRAFT_319200 [Baudoinia panamericana UAMH 10762]